MAMSFKYFLALSILIFCFTACQNRGKVHDQIESRELGDTDKLEGMAEVYYRVPSPDEMLHFIDREKLYFNDEIILPVNSASRYLDSKSQALNLGIYIADLAYITLFERQKEALTYLQVVYGLSDKLRISAAFKPGTMDRFEKNIGNVDSLKALADESLTDISNYLVRQDKEKVMALISIGGFVETLSLAFRMVDDYSPDNIIVQRISDQKLVLDNLINYSLAYAEDNNVEEAISIIHPIRAIYNELLSTEEETSVEKTKEGKLVISGGSKLSMTEEQFYKLRDATLKTRKIITENVEN